MASVTYGKCYLWQKYYVKCNYGKNIMAIRSRIRAFSQIVHSFSIVSSMFRFVPFRFWCSYSETVPSQVLINYLCNFLLFVCYENVCLQCQWKTKKKFYKKYVIFMVEGKKVNYIKLALLMVEGKSSFITNICASIDQRHQIYKKNFHFLF